MSVSFYSRSVSQGLAICRQADLKVLISSTKTTKILTTLQ